MDVGLFILLCFSLSTRRKPHFYSNNLANAVDEGGESTLRGSDFTNYSRFALHTITEEDNEWAGGLRGGSAPGNTCVPDLASHHSLFLTL